MIKLERCYNLVRLQASIRFKKWLRARPRLLRLGASSVLFTVLLAPSIWMLSVIPPLWRDVDAYVQVTQAPGRETILQYSPLYSFAARIPLYVGYAIDHGRASAPVPAPSFFIHPVLTDSGIFVLLLLQHLLLCFAAFHLIAEATRLFWVRVLLALTWANNPLFYTFGHCVGAETLSLILVLLIGATGLRVIRYSRKAAGREWLLFAILLWLCILTRHINAILAGLLPLTFLLLSTYLLTMTRFVRSQSQRRWQGLRARQALQKAAFAVAIGTCSMALANVSLRVLSYAAKTPYHSVVGLAFLGRLKFLGALPVEKRNELLDKVIRNTDSPDVKKFIALLRDAVPAKAPNWDVLAFKEDARSLLFSPTHTSEHEFNIVLNRAALAFLYPPQKILLNAVATDFKKSQEITIPNVVSFLFVATRFYFSHASAMPQCASLVTFRDKNADQVFAIFKTRSYFRHPKNLTHGALLFLWLINLALFIVIAKMRKQDAASLASYAVALTVVGLLVMLANCLLAVFQPRYTLPMWELTIVSVSILSAKTLEYIFAGENKSEKSRFRTLQIQHEL
jgi:hypothetical protein